MPYACPSYMCMCCGPMYAQVICASVVALCIPKLYVHVLWMYVLHTNFFISSHTITKLYQFLGLDDTYNFEVIKFLFKVILLVQTELH
jgi:hypothetical protein